MKIYISGPITNNESCKEDFINASKLLSTKGYDIIDPMTICEPDRLLFSHQRDEAASRGTWNYYMREAIKKLMASDSIYMLRGWEDSHGARLEKYIAEHLGMLILFEGHFDEEETTAAKETAV
jgi:hypothetical protein